MTKHKRRVAIFVGLLVSVVFLWIALRGTNFAEIGQCLRRSNYWWLAPMLAAYAAHFVIKAYRWTMLLAPMKESRTFQVFSPMMIGFMGNNLLPAHLGEFVRMYLGARQLGLRKTQVLATIVLERIFDFLSVVLFLGSVLLVSDHIPEKLVIPGYITGLIGLVFMLVAWVYIAWTEWFLGAVRRLTFFVPKGLQAKVLHQLEVGAAGLYALKRPRLLAGIILTSILQWGFMGLTAYIATRAVGIDTPLASGFVVLAATTFAVTLPAAPGFLGSIQAAFTLALVPYGVSKGDAVAASAVFHVPTYLVVTLLGLYLVKRQGYQLGQLQQAAEDAVDEEDDAAEQEASDPDSDAQGAASASSRG